MVLYYPHLFPHLYLSTSTSLFTYCFSPFCPQNTKPYYLASAESYPLIDFPSILGTLIVCLWNKMGVFYTNRCLNSKHIVLLYFQIIHLELECLLFLITVCFILIKYVYLISFIIYQGSFNVGYLLDLVIGFLVFGIVFLWGFLIFRYKLLYYAVCLAFIFK